jgi:hypothetical protein
VQLTDPNHIVPFCNTSVRGGQLLLPVMLLLLLLLLLQGVLREGRQGDAWQEGHHAQA